MTGERCELVRDALAGPRRLDDRIPVRSDRVRGPYGDGAGWVSRVLQGAIVTECPTFRLTLRAPPDGVPDGEALRRLLKELLRRFGLRCLLVE